MQSRYVIIQAFCIFPLLLSGANKESSWNCIDPQAPVPYTKYPLSYYDTYFTHVYKMLLYFSSYKTERLYAQSLREISNKNLPEAQKVLEELTEQDPSYSYGWTELGFVHLWQGNFKKAQEIFLFVLDHCPCNSYATDGLKEVCLQTERKVATQELALEGYEKLHLCYPDTGVYLFKLGNLQSRTGRWKLAEKTLKEYLVIAPEDSDGAIALANLYYKEGKWSEAAELYRKCPDRIEATEGLARIAMAESDFKQAIVEYEKVVTEYPDSELYLQNLARSYASNLEFSKAKTIYEQITEKFPSNPTAWSESFDVKLHSDPSIGIESSYIVAKENDPSLQMPVVKDYYLNSNVWITLPIRDQWNVEINPYFNIQKEKSIVPTNPGINYDVDISGCVVHSKALAWTYWSWDAFLNVKRAWNIGNNAYPFQDTTRLEPGAYVKYQSDAQLFVLGGNVDSYIIKNFAKVVSELLTFKSIDANYRYTFPVRFQPELEGFLEESYVESLPRNRRDTQEISFRVRVPFLEKYFKAFYSYEHRHFKRLNVNYYSFKQQMRDTIGFTSFLGDYNHWIYAELTYWHRWQKTKNLYQPIGDFVYIASMQNLKCNQVQGSLFIRIADKVKFETSGSYYHDTLPYRFWSIGGNLQCVF